MSERKAGRPAGQRNAMPTQAEIAGYLRVLREKAQRGDVQAIAALVDIHDRRKGA